MFVSMCRWLKQLTAAKFTAKRNKIVTYIREK